MVAVPFLNLLKGVSSMSPIAARAAHSASSSAHSARSTRSTAASCARSLAASHARRPARAPWPPAPEALLPQEVREELIQAIKDRACAWQEYLDSPPLLWRDSEPFWGERASEGCPRSLPREMRLVEIGWNMALEVERAVRLLVWQWWPQGATNERQQAALRGVFLRIGQFYREAQRRACRRDPERGLRLLRAALKTLP